MQNAVIVLFICVMDAYAQGGVLPSMRISQPQLYQSRPFSAPTFQQRPSLQSFQQQPSASSYTRSMQQPLAMRQSSLQWVAAEGDAAKAPKPPSGEAPQYVNVYGVELEQCQRKTYIDYCGWRSAVDAEHDICVAEAPRGQPEAARAITMEKISSYKCVSITNFAQSVSGGFAILGGFGPLGAGAYQDFVPNCNALPAGVLDSTYTKDLVAKGGEGLNIKRYSYVSETSSAFKGRTSAEKSVPAGQKREAQYLDAIRTICDACVSQAPNDGAKKQVEDMCGVLPLDVSAALAEEEEPTVSVFTVTLINLFIGSGVVFAVLHFRRRTSQLPKEPLMVA